MGGSASATWTIILVADGEWGGVVPESGASILDVPQAGILALGDRLARLPRARPAQGRGAQGARDEAGRPARTAHDDRRREPRGGPAARALARRRRGVGADALLWLAGAAYDVVVDEARGAIAALAPVASVAVETSSWPYRHDRDLTGSIDGSENPSLARASGVAIVPPGAPGGGGSVLLLQRWRHDVEAWESLPASSHVARTDQDDFGHVFRRTMPYGTVTAHGTMFVGFAGDQGPLARMLDSMAGLDGPRDELTRYTTPETGA